MSRWLWRLAFWFALIACTYLALTPAPPDAVADISDVILHIAAFVVLTGLLGLAHPMPLLAVALSMFAYGGAIEIAQMQIAERTAEWKDLGVDVLGIGIGLVLLHTFGHHVDRALRFVLVKLKLEEEL